MKGKPHVMLASALILLISCNRAEPQRTWSIDHNQKQIIFFSDKDEYEDEVSYYDAIIKLKKDYPEEIKNMKILSSSEIKNYNEIFKINQCPALLVYYKDEVIVDIEGEATIEEIFLPISDALSSP